MKKVLAPEQTRRIDEVISKYNYFKPPNFDGGIVYDTDAYRIILPAHTQFSRKDRQGDCAEITNSALFELRESLPELFFYALSGTHDNYFPYPWKHNFIGASVEDVLGISRSKIDETREGRLHALLHKHGLFVVDASLHSLEYLGFKPYFVETISSQKSKMHHSLDGVFQHDGKSWSKAAIGMSRQGAAYITPNSMNPRDWNMGFIRSGRHLEYHVADRDIREIAKGDPLVEAWRDFFLSAPVYK